MLMIMCRSLMLKRAETVACCGHRHQHLDHPKAGILDFRTDVACGDFILPIPALVWIVPFFQIPKFHRGICHVLYMPIAWGCGLQQVALQHPGAWRQPLGVNCLRTAGSHCGRLGGKQRSFARATSPDPVLLPHSRPDPHIVDAGHMWANLVLT